MTRRKTPAKRRDPYPVLTLSARAAPARRVTERCIASQEDLCGLWNITTQTARNWVAKGLPIYDREGVRPRFLWWEILAWGSCYLDRKRRNAVPRRLSMEEAYAFQLRQQFRQFPQDFIMVPLDWDHPWREQQLRKAAAGRQPPPPRDDFNDYPDADSGEEVA